MSFNATIVPSLDIGTQFFDSVTVDQKIFEGNKLIANASLLINLALKLRSKFVPKDAFELKKKLIQEVKIFEDLISNYDYSPEIILRARYGLCAFIDDMLMYTTWGNAINWEHNGLLYTFDKESSAVASKHFFAILKEASENPSSNIDILELYYIFLTLGFGSKYRGLPKGKDAVSKFTNELYDCISGHRVHFDNTLFQEEIPTIKERIKQKIDYKHVAIFGIIGILFLCFFYFYLNSNLNTILRPLMDNIQTTIG